MKFVSQPGVSLIERIFTSNYLEASGLRCKAPQTTRLSRIFG